MKMMDEDEMFQLKEPKHFVKKIYMFWALCGMYEVYWWIKNYQINET